MFVFFSNSCSSQDSIQNNNSTPASRPLIFTSYSTLENQYEGFNSPKAINKIADIENTHLRCYKDSISPYYGTIWRGGAEIIVDSSGESLYQRYVKALGRKPDSMHCTIYAVEGLKAGFGNSFPELDKSHKKIWGKREYAGWSLGYLLVKEYGWQAYLIIDPASKEYNRCVKAFKTNKTYPVWYQPAIPLVELFVIGKDDTKVDSLLKQNEFGWGFSYQGIHTWITRFDELKECIWNGAPCAKYELYDVPSPSVLFKKTPFLEFRDYDSHVVIFPPKIAHSH
jgi:hypothetical protein